jgi:hypothetical protein
VIRGHGVRVLAGVTAAWSVVTRRDVLRMALLFLLYSTILTISRVPQLVRDPAWGPPLNALLSAQLNGFAVMFAVLVADRVCARDDRRSWPYALAVVAGVALGTSSLWLLSQVLVGIPTAISAAGAHEPFATFAFRHGLYNLAVCGLGTAVYVVRSRAVRREAALAAAHRERSDAERRLLEARLAAMQARVEPRFLLDALGRVERLYRTDRAAGDRMLQELVRYLRAAIPHMRESESTIAREVALADAYLAVVAEEPDARPRVTASGASSWDARIPPMLVLPLVEHALAHRRQAAGSSRAAGFGVVASVRDGRLRLEIRDPDGGFAPRTAQGESILQLRERLATLHGARASLVLRDGAAASEVVVELPLAPD